MRAQAVSDYLHALDSTLLQIEQIDKTKEKRINQLRELFMATSSEREKYEVANQLYGEYDSFQFDSAMTYVNRMFDLARSLNDPNLICESQSHKVFALHSAGNFKEAFDVLDSISLQGVAPHYRFLYYKTRMTLNYTMAYFSHDTPYRQAYLNDGYLCADSICKILEQGDPQRKMVEFLRYVRLRNVTLGNKLAEQLLIDERISMHEKAIITSGLASLRHHSGDKNGVLEMLAQSAIYDIRASVKENSSLAELATQLYHEGDKDRANRYIHQALADAEFYRTRVRLSELGQVIPIIESDRYNQLQRERNGLVLSFIGLGLVTSLLGVALWWLFRYNKKLRQARRTIAEHQAELQQANDKLSAANAQLVTANENLNTAITQLNAANARLSESNDIKDEYVGRSFYAASQHLASKEQLSRFIDSKLAARQYEGLRRQLKESTLSDERDAMFSSFDAAFLKLFPNFVDDFNAMFASKDQRQPSGKFALTTEMRIFALIRLGISDSERIAKFLDYSVHTINTYKTRVKNRSLIDNDLFEAQIMKIGR